jgi:type IX secretion system PorP/SprF family membrane protein
MKRIPLIILATLYPFLLGGQMLPVTHHYMFDALAINPAFAGCNNALSAILLYRNQWVGFSDAPKSQMLSVHVPVNQDRVGLGLLVEYNSIGIFRETSFIGNYAYRMELGSGKLALGLGFGAILHNIAWNELNAADPNDVQLLNNPESAILPAFSLGSYYYGKKYFIGLSLPLFLSQELDQRSGKYKSSNKFSAYNIFLSGGYEFVINRNLKLLPSVLVKYKKEDGIRIDYNALINVNDKFWVGAGYRNKNVLVGMLQCQLTYQIRLGYSYDFEMGTLQKYTSGSHEIVLNYIFRYARKVAGPRQF